jgi:hypothetical protein
MLVETRCVCPSERKQLWNMSMPDAMDKKQNKSPTPTKNKIKHMLLFSYPAESKCMILYKFMK